MFGKHPAQVYPALAEFLTHASSDLRMASRYGIPIGLLVGGLGLVGSVWTATHSGLASMVALLPALSSPFFFSRAYRSRTPEDRQREEANAVARLLKGLMDTRRLQRALDEASLVLMDEASRCWGRVQAALGNDSWANSGFATVRDQARWAADDGMQQIMLLYRDAVKGGMTNANWTPRDFMNDVVETFGGRRTMDDRMPPAAYYEARRVCERMRDLADEAERIAREAPAAPSATHRLDAALGEMRAIREAEEELRERH
ncbi:hypothetical protein BH11ARM2_BH11ARM2_04020 [soil metagenome]